MLKLCFFLSAFVFVLYPSIGFAQSLHDQVQEHVEESLEEEQQEANEGNKPDKPDKPDKPTGNKPTGNKPTGNKPTGGSSNDRPPGETLAEFDTSAQAAENEKNKGPKLPRRVFHKYFKVDLEAGGGYRGWSPQQYPTVAVDMAHYFTWSVGAKARLFNLITLRKAYYESNYLASPRTSYFASAAKIGGPSLKAAWFLTELGVPILNAWEPVLLYEARAFRTTATAKDGAAVCVIPYRFDSRQTPCGRNDDGTRMLYPGDTLQVTSGFEIAMLGVRYHPSKNPDPVIHERNKFAPPILFGVSYLSYLKPYQVTIADNVLDEFIFTGRFYGGGLALGTDFGGGVNKLKVDIWAQAGIGKVRLTRNLTLNELAPDWTIGYVQGHLKLKFPWCPFKFAPSIIILPEGVVSGATFFFFKTNTDEGDRATTPNINWDVLYSARLSLIITF